MKKLVFFCALIFIFSFGIGFIYSSFIKNIFIKDNASESFVAYENQIENKDDFVETAQSEEKVSYNADFALKKY